MIDSIMLTLGEYIVPIMGVGILLIIGIIVATSRKPKRGPISSRRAKLIGIKGKHRGKKVSIYTSQIHQRPFLIGRTKENSLILKNDLVSRIHAQIAFQDNLWVLYDRDSANGTWVNGQRIAQHYLRPNDEIMIGSSVFKFEGVGARTPPVKPDAAFSSGQFTPSEIDLDIKNYQNLGEIASGGMATIYKAQSPDGKIIAFKFLNRTDPYLKQKFQGEIRLGQTLHHPNITRIYGGGISTDGKLYFAMEYIDGRTLRHYINNLSLDVIIKIIGQICDALQYAHKLGVYHRDLKPENIMIDNNGTSKVIDFGIAKVDSEITKTATGAIIGTPFYLSYEQAKGRRVDGRSDIYSLGIVLYEMLTGRPPFYSEDPLEVVNYHVKKRPIKPRDINPEIPAHMEAAVLRCMEKDINKRFQNAIKFARAIGYTPQIVSNINDTISNMRIPTEIVVESTGKIIPINYSTTELCREDINSEDYLISRKHAQIMKQDGRCWIKDNESSNGTFLNGIRISQPSLLQSGDQIRVGKTILQFRDK